MWHTQRKSKGGTSRGGSALLVHPSVALAQEPSRRPMEQPGCAFMYRDHVGFITGPAPLVFKYILRTWACQVVRGHQVNVFNTLNLALNEYGTVYSTGGIARVWQCTVQVKSH